jgi:hypothetical protein
MSVHNWGVKGTFTETGVSESIGPSEKALIIIEAGAATVQVEVQPPESATWVVAAADIDASSDAVKVYEAPACRVRLNCTAYTSATNYWLIASSNKS